MRDGLHRGFVKIRDVAEVLREPLVWTDPLPEGLLLRFVNADILRHSVIEYITEREQLNNYINEEELYGATNAVQTLPMYLFTIQNQSKDRLRRLRRHRRYRRHRRHIHWNTDLFQQVEDLRLDLTDDFLLDS